MEFYNTEIESLQRHCNRARRYLIKNILYQDLSLKKEDIDKAQAWKIQNSEAVEQKAYIFSVLIYIDCKDYSAFIESFS